VTKFATKQAPPHTTAAVKTTGGRAYTGEGHLGYERDAKSDLFLLAVTNMVREQTFYEGANERDERFKQLVHVVTREDPLWVAQFIPYLRDTMQMRSASTVAAAHYVAAGGPRGRAVVASALRRADEPAEILAYWQQEYGRRIPKPLKRGVADAVVDLYNERAALKYDGQGRAWRMGDVIELVHPKPLTPWQSALFQYLIDVRHNRDFRGNLRGVGLTKIAKAHWLEDIDVEARRSVLREEGAQTLADAGFTWERLSGWLQGPMDAEAWETVIPSMGYMALLRNLRNFEQAGVSEAVLAQIGVKLADPAEVARSRQFPLRFLSAYKTIPSERFAFPLQQAVEHSVKNIPELKGRTLILIDVSGSMQDSLSGRSQLRRWEAAALFGVALAKRCEIADTVAYQSQAWRVDTDQSVLRHVTEISQLVGGGTNTWQALGATFDNHDRVVILTDEQAHPGAVPDLPCALYTFNLAGYRVAHAPSGEKGRYTFGGLTDAGFRLIPLLEEYRSVGWPFMESE
jgi:hypothetical protein